MLAVPQPLVSVGIPTYNRPEGLRRTLRCITGQTHSNLEIIISDNCSPGAETEMVAREFMKGDHRIQYFRQAENKGATFNFDFVLRKATGEYFMWAADDDLWEPTYISSCVKALDDNPRAVLCTTAAVSINREGDSIGMYDEDIDTVGLDTLSRLAKVIKGMTRHTSFYGVTRREVTSQIHIRNHFGWDHVFTAELSLYGEFVRLPQHYFYCRTGGSCNSVEEVIRAQQIRSPLVRVFPYLTFFAEFLRAATTWHMLRWSDRLRAMRFIVRRFTSLYYLLLIWSSDLRLPLPPMWSRAFLKKWFARGRKLMDTSHSR